MEWLYERIGKLTEEEKLYRATDGLQDGSKEVYNEKISELKESIKKKFTPTKSDNTMTLLNGELKEYISTLYDPEDAGISHNNAYYDPYIKNYREINNRQIEFREAIVEVAFSLALEHTDEFKTDNEYRKQHTISNINSILKYSPTSITTIMPIINELDENSLKEIIDANPQSKDYILDVLNKENGEKQTLTQEKHINIKDRLKEISEKFKELMDGNFYPTMVEMERNNETENVNGIYRQNKLKELEGVKEDIKRRFSYVKSEGIDEYSYEMNTELKEHIRLTYNYEDLEIRKAVVEAAVSLSLENTDWFDVNNEKVVDNINRILEYSPNSITTIMSIIEELNEEQLKSIYEKNPEVEKYILEKEEEESKFEELSEDKQRHYIGKRLRKIERRFESVEKEMEEPSVAKGELDDEGDGDKKILGIRKKMREALKELMGIDEEFEILDIYLGKELINNKGINKE